MKRIPSGCRRKKLRLTSAREARNGGSYPSVFGRRVAVGAAAVYGIESRIFSYPVQFFRAGGPVTVFRHYDLCYWSLDIIPVLSGTVVLVPVNEYDGIRYAVSFNGQERYIYLVNNRWYVQSSKEAK